jgi:hypothetical protein
MRPLAAKKLSEPGSARTRHGRAIEHDAVSTLVERDGQVERDEVAVPQRERRADVEEGLGVRQYGELVVR